MAVKRRASEAMRKCMINERVEKLGYSPGMTRDERFHKTASAAKVTKKRGVKPFLTNAIALAGLFVCDRIHPEHVEATPSNAAVDRARLCGRGIHRDQF